MFRLLLGKQQAVPSASTQQPLFIYVILELFYSEVSHVVFTVSRTQFVRAVVGLLLSWTMNCLLCLWKLINFYERYEKFVLGSFTHVKRILKHSLSECSEESHESQNYSFPVTVSELGLSWGIYWAYPGIYLRVLKKKNIQIEVPMMSPAVCAMFEFSRQSQLKILTLCFMLGRGCRGELDPCCLFICFHLFLATEGQHGCVVVLGVSLEDAISDLRFCISSPQATLDSSFRQN